MFDSIWVPCPKCGKENEFQSKSGECVLGNYSLRNAPAEALAGVNRHSPQVCTGCGASFRVKLHVTGTPELVACPD